MIRIAREAWDLRSAALKEKLKSNWDELKYCNYKYLVELTMGTLFNESNLLELNLKEITEIDNGDYQGTLLYLIPFDTYQPGPNEYLMTYVYYGSCSGCDTLQAIQSNMYWNNEPGVGERVINDFMKLCRDLVMNIRTPYPHYHSNFEVVEW